MANAEHLAILRQGVGVWNEWQKNPHHDIRPNLNEADLSGSNLRGAYLRRALLQQANLNDADLTEADLGVANLSGAHLCCTKLYGAYLLAANLTEADLGGASLREAYLHQANLSGANLVEADLYTAHLRGAHLHGANLSRANLCEADLSGADLRGVELQQAMLGDTTFGNNDLATTNGLDTILHRGPSTIGIDTLVRSGGKIPQVFLRGCGVPDSVIEYLPALIGAMEPIQYYSCFISYCTKDEDFTRRLHSRMRDNHLRVWFADEDMKSGQKIHEQIDQAIRVHDKLVLVLSEQSIQSEWVMTEIRKARKAELKSGRRKLFPLRLVDMDTLREWECFDADTGKDLAVEVREYFIPDFTRWKDHDSFERAFARFLKDLQATEAPPIPREATKNSDDTKTSAQQSVIDIKKRRLRLLEEQQARKGHDTEPHILMEIEDLRREIGELEQ